MKEHISLEKSKLCPIDISLSTVLVDQLASSNQDGFQYAIFEVNRILMLFPELFSNFNNKSKIIDSIKNISKSQGTEIMGDEPFIDRYKLFNFASMLSCNYVLNSKITNFMRALAIRVAFTSSNVTKNSLLYKRIRKLIRNTGRRDDKLIIAHIESGDIFNTKKMQTLIKQMRSSPTKKILSLYLNLEQSCFIEVVNTIYSEQTISEEPFKLDNKEIIFSRYWFNRMSIITPSSLQLLTLPERKTIASELDFLSETQPLISEILKLAYLVVPLEVIYKLQIEDINGEVCLRIPCIPPANASKIIKDERFINSDHYYEIDLKINFPSIHDLFTQQNGKNSIAFSELIPINFEDALKSQKSLIKRAKKHYSRINNIKFGSESARRTWLTDSNIALTYLIHGAHRWQPVIENYYIQIDSNKIIEQLNRNAETLFISVNFPLSKFSSVLGCNNTIEIKYLANLLESKRKATYRLLNRANSKEQLVFATNQYGLYISNLIYIFAGVRYLNSLFKHRILFVPELNLLFILDKPTFHFHSERPVCIPSKVTLQIIDYLELREVIIGNFENKATLPFIFTIHNNVIDIPEVKDCANFMGENYDFMTKIRHTARTWFENQDSKTSLDNIRTQFGHGISYRNPFGKSSINSIFDWINEMAGMSNKFVEELNFKVFKVKNKKRYSTLGVDKCHKRISYVSPSSKADLDIEIVKKISNALGFCDKRILKIEDREFLKNELLTTFEDISYINRLCDRHFNYLRSSRKNKVEFSTSRYLRKEESPFTINFVLYLNQSITIECILKSIIIDEMDAKLRDSYTFAVDCFFNLKTISLSPNNENNFDKYRLARFFKSIQVDFIFDRECFNRVITVRAKTIIPGCIYAIWKDNILNSNNSSLSYSLDLNARPKLIVDNSIDDALSPKTTKGGINKVKITVRKMLHTSSGSDKDNQLLVIKLKLLINEENLSLTSEHFVGWVIELIMLGGPIVSIYNNSSVDQKISIGSHLDKIFDNYNFAKLIRRKAFKLVEEYLSDENVKISDGLSTEIGNWLDYCFSSTSRNNSYAKKSQKKQNKNIIILKEYNYLIQTYFGTYLKTKNLIHLAKAYATVIGYKASTRSSEVKEMKPKDIQTYDDSYIFIIQNSKTEAGRRVIYNNNFSSNEKIIINTIKTIATNDRSVISTVCGSKSILEACFRQINLDLRIITGDPKIRFHDLGGSTINEKLEQELKPYNQFFPENDISPVIRHRSYLTSLIHYGIFTYRYFEKYYYFCVTGWNNKQIANILQLEPSNARKLKSRRGLPKKPFGIFPMTQRHQPIPLVFDHNELDDFVNSCQDIELYDYFLILLTNQESLTEAFKHIAISNPLLHSLIQHSFILNIKQPLKGGVIRVILTAAKLVKFKPKVKPNDKGEDEDYVDLLHMQMILSTLFVNRDLPQNKTFIALRDAKKFISYIGLMGIRQVFHIRQTESSCVIELLSGAHTLNYPKYIWIYLELFLIYLTRENKT
ncbi:MAG: hypothetical protein COA86_02280 [Kangiella sp.]|nr:MAG: hypothetical protein COA86_02280 [Kangiella sp.]